MQNNKEATIYDIAQKLKISPTTVSRALQGHTAVNKLTRKRVFDMAERIGYRSNHFARNLRNQKTHTIGVIIPRLNSYFMSSVIAGLEKVANSEGYTLLISQSSEEEQNEVASAKTMFNNRVDGLIVSLANDTRSLSHFEPFLKKKVPLVFFDRVMESANASCIVIDNRKAGYDATKHLIEQGSRRIIYLTAQSLQNVYSDRLKGYKQALAEHSIPFREEYIIRNNMSLENGKSVAEIILKMKPMPDGIFAANDNSAVGCMLALMENGVRIPEDVAVVGFNNDPVSQVIEPKLTTVNYPGTEMGEIAAHQLINHLKKISSVQATNSIILRSYLIERASSLRKR